MVPHVDPSPVILSAVDGHSVKHTEQDTNDGDDISELAPGTWPPMDIIERTSVIMHHREGEPPLS